jgi:hypothetical protein
MKLSRRAFAISVVLLVVVLSGCGTPPTPGPSATTASPSGSSATVPPTTLTPPPETGTTPTTLLPKISGFLAQSVSFVSADEGYVLGDVPCPTGACLALRKTTNRGVSWSSATVPPAALGESNYSGGAELQFANSLDGWAYGATLWATHDGAVQWNEVDLGGTVVAMASGRDEVYALVEPCGTASTCNAPGRLYRSPVDQDSWTEVRGEFDEFAAGQFSLVVEGSSVFVLAAYPKAELLASSDGIHFVSLAVPCGPQPDQTESTTPGALAASDPSHIAVLCLGDPGAGQQHKEVFISHDGGQRFERLPGPDGAELGGELSMPAPNTLLFGVSTAATSVSRMTAPDTRWVGSIGFRDGGAGLSDLAFVDPDHGAFIHGPASITRSLLSLPHPPSGLGEVYLTADGGSSWYPTHIR